MWVIPEMKFPNGFEGIIPITKVLLAIVEIGIWFIVKIIPIKKWQLKGNVK